MAGDAGAERLGRSVPRRSAVAAVPARRAIAHRRGAAASLPRPTSQLRRRSPSRSRHRRCRTPIAAIFFVVALRARRRGQDSTRAIALDLDRPRSHGPACGWSLAIIVALLLLPMVFVTLGFVASSTLLFAVAATTLRGRRPRRRARSRSISRSARCSRWSCSSSFTRGLGVSLPGLPSSDGRAPRGLRGRADAGQPAVGAGRHDARHRRRRAAGHRPGAHRRAAAAGHLRPRSHGGADHVRRHLLRRDVRRIDDVDPAEHAGRERDDRDRARWPSDGAQRARRRGAGHRRDRIVRRRHARHARAQRHRAADGASWRSRSDPPSTSR